MEKKIDVVENLLYIAVGIFMAIAVVAMLCGDGNKGLLDLL